MEVQETTRLDRTLVLAKDLGDKHRILLVPSTSGLGLQNLAEKLSLDDTRPLTSQQQQTDIDQHNTALANQLQARQDHDRAVQQHQQAMAINQILLMGGHIVGPRGEIITVAKVGGVSQLITSTSDPAKTVPTDDKDEEGKTETEKEVQIQ